MKVIILVQDFILMLNFIFEIEIKLKNSLFLKRQIMHLQMRNPGVFMNKYLKNEGDRL